MKKSLFSFLLVLFCLTSCKTAERIIYFQDAQYGKTFDTQATKALTLVPGDNIGVMVTVLQRLSSLFATICSWQTAVAVQ